MSLPRTSRPVFRPMGVALAAALTLAGATACELVAPVDTPAPGAAGALLAELTVADAGSMRGYSRSRFPHWRSTGENCNVRDAVLRRDGEKIKLKGCNVVGGTWFSSYDGKTFTDPAKVDVDHMVPLANAWRSGAADWTDDQRADFANDVDRPQLRAVSATANRAKGDQDPSLWKPARREAWCGYAEDWITVKHHWRLSVTAAERTALDKMLETCEWVTQAP